MNLFQRNRVSEETLFWLGIESNSAPQRSSVNGNDDREDPKEDLEEDQNGNDDRDRDEKYYKEVLSIYEQKVRKEKSKTR